VTAPAQATAPAPVPAAPKRRSTSRSPAVRVAENPLVRESWVEQGACTPEHAKDNWDPNRHTDPRRVEEAQRMCATCPVAAACLAYAKQIRPTDGVWGGKSFFRNSWSGS